MTEEKQKIKDRLDIPEGWKLEADWGKGEVPENIEYRQIDGRFSISVADATAILSDELEITEEDNMKTREAGEVIEIEESFIITMGIQPDPEQFMGDLSNYVMIHAYPVSTGAAEKGFVGEELEIAFDHFVSIADAMQSLMSLLEL